MNFILVNNNQVISGPKPWNKHWFESALLYDLDIKFELPFTNDVCLKINDTVILYPISIVEPDNFNPKIHHYAGPFWEFTDSNAIGTYKLAERDINHVKSDLKNTVALNRYNKEIAGTYISFNGLKVYIDTTRHGKLNFMYQYMSISEQDKIVWKFTEGWVTLSKSDIKDILDLIATFIKSAFAWELEKCKEIDLCSTLDELDAVILD